MALAGVLVELFARRRDFRTLDRPRRDLRIRVVYEVAQLAFRQALQAGVLCYCRW